MLWTLTLGTASLPSERGSSPKVNLQFYFGISTLSRIVCQSGTPLALSWLWALVGWNLGPSRNGVDSVVRFDATGSKHEMGGSAPGTNLQPRNDLPAPSPANPCSCLMALFIINDLPDSPSPPASRCSRSPSPSPPHLTLVQLDLQRLSLSYSTFNIF